MNVFTRALSVLSVGGALFLAANVNSLAAAELKISGAPAITVPIIMLNKAAIEKETGLTLNADNDIKGANP